ncbi:hypothetical protein HETIRDRAFT_316863, partial [Heterobasidion irregulare TC 32-1]
IGFKAEWAITIWVNKDGSRCEAMFQLFKGLVPFASPFKWYILLCEVVERSGCGSKVLDESAVEVSKAKEGLYFFQVLRGWPGGDSIDLD